jgi:ribosomal protein S20
VIRADVSEARTAMDSQMRQVQSALQNGDVEGARRNLQSAQNAIDALERAIGK